MRNRRSASCPPSGLHRILPLTGHGRCKHAAGSRPGEDANQGQSGTPDRAPCPEQALAPDSRQSLWRPGRQPEAGRERTGAVDSMPSHVPGVNLACTSDVPEQAGNPTDLRICLAGTGRGSRRYSRRSRGDLPSKASAGPRRGTCVAGAARGPWKVNRAGARTRSLSTHHAAASPTAQPGPSPAQVPGRLRCRRRQGEVPAPRGRRDRQPPPGQCRSRP